MQGHKQYLIVLPLDCPGLRMSPLTHDRVVCLEPETPLPAFDCGDPDLNEFLKDDAKRYQAELLAVTYLVMEADQIAAFFSLSNDKLTCAPEDSTARRIWNRIQRKIPNCKRRQSYPAVKIGRLGVCTNMQRHGLGQEILDWLKILFLTDNRTGCRFITVDAYNNEKTIAFYERNDFKFLAESDEGLDTRQMYFDLKPFAELMAAAGHRSKASVRTGSKLALSL